MINIHANCQGLTVCPLLCEDDNVDDAEEMRLTDEAFDILNFKPVNKHKTKSKKK